MKAWIYRLVCGGFLLTSGCQGMRHSMSVRNLPQTQKHLYYLLKDSLLQGGIKKWRSNPRIRLVGSYSSQEVLMVRQAIKTINQHLKEIHLQYAESPEAANVKIFFSSAHKYRDLLKRHPSLRSAVRSLPRQRGVCFLGTEQGVISQALIVVFDRQSAWAKREAVEHELMHMLGFSHVWRRDSILAEGEARSRRLSELDLAALRQFYTARFAQGMSQDELITALKAGP